MVGGESVWIVKDLGAIKGTELFAAIRSYDEGEEKLSVYRKVGKDKDKTRQVFRLPTEDARALAKFIKKNLKENKDD